MNKVILIGRLTKDPDVRYANEKAVARFNLAVDRRYKQDGGQTADFPSCVAFGKTAEFIEKYIRQGVKIAIEGRIQTGSYEKDGVKHYTTDVIVEAVEFAESKKTDTQETPMPDNDGFMKIPEGVEDQLPFE